MANQNRKDVFVSPFDGEPRTVVTIDPDDGERFEITVCELTPERAKTVEALANLTVIAAMIALIAVFIDKGDIHPMIWLTSLALPVFAYRGVAAYYRNGCLLTTNVIITAAHLRVQQGETGAWYVLDRTLGHRFLMLEHDKARDEREEQARKAQAAQMRGRVETYTRYFDDSFHIVFEYLGHRFDVVTVFGRLRAKAVFDRLKACDAVMDSKNRMGNGAPLSPDDQWTNAPGGLPD